MQAGREIKFRAAYKLMDEWEVFDVDMLGYDENGEMWVQDVRGNGCSQGTFKLLQFTGLHDKNGKEIYEGDILLDSLGNYRSVHWSDYFGAFRVSRHDVNLSSIADTAEIAGNIYEDQKLLKY